MLTESQVEQYFEDGYVTPDFKFPEEVTLSIQSRHEKLLETHPEYRDCCPAILEHDIVFVDYCRNEQILDTVQQLIGRDIALWNARFC